MSKKPINDLDLAVRLTNAVSPKKTRSVYTEQRMEGCSISIPLNSCASNSRNRGKFTTT